MRRNGFDSVGEIYRNDIAKSGLKHESGLEGNRF